MSLTPEVQAVVDKANLVYQQVDNSSEYEVIKDTVSNMLGARVPETYVTSMLRSPYSVVILHSGGGIRAMSLKPAPTIPYVRRIGSG